MEADVAAITLVELEHEDSHLPRLLRRRPYNPLSDGEAAEVRLEADAIIRGVERMIYKAVLTRLDRRERRHQHIVDEIVQDVRSHIAGYALSHFDSSRGARLTTFLQVVINRRAAGQLDSHRRRRRRERHETLSNDMAIAPDESADRWAESLGAKLLSDPASFGLTVAEARAVQAVIDAGPDVQRQTISRQLGYAYPSTFSTTLLRARKKILAAAEAHW
jgi:hypothetical protein